jgi:hypothetical protein
MQGSVKQQGRRAVWRAAAVMALAGAAIVAVQAQGPVTLYVSATDANGATVSDIKPEEFSYKEAGQAGKVTSIEKFSLPIKLTIVVDNSPDSAQALSSYRTGLTELVKVLPADVEVTLVTMAPQPRTVVKPTTNRDEINRGITRFAPESESGSAARFTDSLVEYAKRLDKERNDSKEKRLPYSPALIVVSTTAAESTSYQMPDMEKALGTIANTGTRVMVAMTTTKTGNTEATQDMNSGRQALIAIPLTKATRGRYEALAQFNRLATLLPEFGKNLAEAHKRQVDQVKVTIERPAGSTGPLKDLDVRLLRAGLNGAVSGDGRFFP